MIFIISYKFKLDKKTKDTQKNEILKILLSRKKGDFFKTDL